MIVPIMNKNMNVQIHIYDYNCSYITFMIVPIINKNVIMKYITIY